MLGDDLGSQVVTEHCAAAGVDLSPSAHVAGPTAGITVVLNFDGDRGFVTHLPSAAASERAEIQRWLGVLRAERPAWCYLHAGRLVPPFLREARELGCKIMLDTSLGDERERDAVDRVRRAGRHLRAQLRRADQADRRARTWTRRSRRRPRWGTQLVVTRGKAGAAGGRTGRLGHRGVATASGRSRSGI